MSLSPVRQPQREPFRYEVKQLTRFLDLEVLLRQISS